VSLLPVDHAPAPPSSSGPGAEEFAAEVARGLGQPSGILTATGRAAMTALFRHLNLGRDDEVYIATTFDLPHVAACVTCTVFNFARPSRVLTARTRAIFVIHEFGVPHPGTPALREEARRRGIPLIEDCAHTVASVAADGWRVGELANWAIVSFPKVLPVRAGGLLAGPPVTYESGPCSAAAADAAAWWPSRAEQMERRRAVFEELAGRARRLGQAPLFDPAPGTVPWFFPVPVREPHRLMDAARRAGVECGLWHGSDIVVLPCHQFLGEAEIEAISAVLAGGAA
jgi:dTDP-4-amino-4,6-dideoxygalactose transaminase